MKDFGYRAAHAMAYYGIPPKYSVIAEGRDGTIPNLSAPQRYSEDYDVIAITGMGHGPGTTGDENSSRMR